VGTAPPVRRAHLVAYGLPGLAFAALQLPLYISLPTFYARDLGLGLAAVGAILLAVRVFDVLTDPLLGYLSDHGLGRYGRRKPFIFLGLPLLMLSGWYLLVPPPSPGPGYLVVWSLGATFAATAMQVAYQAWGAELSDQYHERTRISAGREAFVVLGTLVAIAVPAAAPGGLGEGLRLLAVGLLVLLPLTVSCLLLVVPEPEPLRARTPSAGRGWQTLAANRPFRKLILAYFINGFANGLPATLFLLYVERVLGLEGTRWTGLFVLLYLGTAMLSLPVWLALSRRWGKHRTWSRSMLASCVAFLGAVLLGPGDVIWFAAVCVTTGVFCGADLAIPPSIQADVVDVDQARTGEGRAGLFFALWSMATKLALAAAVGVAFPLLDWTAAEDGVPGRTAVVVLYAVLPIVLKLGAVAAMRGFDLDARMQTELRRGIRASAATGDRR